MDNLFGTRLKELRRARGLSQKEFAEKLSMSFQSVSKWENGLGVPNITLIPTIADILKVSCDHLIGHNSEETQSKYSELYKNEAYFWSTTPNSVSYRLLQQFPPREYCTVLELGCGEGRDAVFLGSNHYNVTAIDKVSEGIDKAIRLAQVNEVHANFICADIRSFTSAVQYDLVYGYRILHYLTPQERPAQISRYQDMTRIGGIHAFTVCVEKSFIPRAPDHEEETVLFRSGELFGYYADWELLYINEETVDCQSSGIPHRHVVDTVIARKIR